MKEAAERCQGKQLRNRSRFRRVLLANRDATELQRFSSDIEKAVTTFEASYYLLILQAFSAMSAHVNGQQRSAGVQQMIQQFVSVYFWTSVYEA